MLKEVEKAKLKLEGKVVFDEEHSLLRASVWPAAQPENQLGARFDRGIQASARTRQVDRRIQQAALHHQNNGTKIVKEKAQDVLNYVVDDAKKDFTITRFKGLGEMNAEQLWETTMNQDTRTLLQVKLEDAVAAEDIFTTLMGENVEARRKFIEENALDVQNLDI